MTMFRSYNDYASAIRPSHSESYKSENDNYDTAVMKYNCSACKRGYTSETEVEVHKQTEHRRDLVFTPMTQKFQTLCLVCSKRFSTRDVLISHVKSKHLFSSKDAKRVERAIYACDICQRIFFVKGLLVIHLLRRHNPTQQNVTQGECPHCMKSVRFTSMWCHFEHQGLKSVSTCPLCLKKLDNRKALSKHARTHPYHFKCDTCLYETTKRPFFLNHLEKNHRTANPSLGDEIQNISRYFIGNIPLFRWRYVVQFVPSGLNLHSMLKICILCREICTSIAEMRSHIANNHMSTALKSVTGNNKICSCGEVFSNGILLKHHVFKLQGMHKALEQGELNDYVEVYVMQEEEQEDQ